MIDDSKVKMTIEGYELKQLRVNRDGRLNIFNERWKGREIAIVLLEKPEVD